MKKLIVVACLATTVSLTAGTAMADSIKGRVGVTGKIGVLIPADNKSDFYTNKTDAGFIGGGGFIYGIDDHFAAELDVTRSSFGSETGDFGVTNVSLGGQYRFALTQHQLVPYLGAGLDILVSDYDPNDGQSRNVDTTVGVHGSAGIDYFLQRNLALTAEAKLVVAPDTSITDQSGAHRGDFDPTSFSSTAGIRFFFN
ncbi:MAG: porin family protein [Proteobacteria bacterium]|nr:porin family protein [Pseudomonadota bacterium]